MRRASDQEAVEGRVQQPPHSAVECSIRLGACEIQSSRSGGEHRYSAHGSAGAARIAKAHDHVVRRGAGVTTSSLS